MTRLRWTEPANDDLLGIVEWIKARNSQAAARVGRRILEAAEGLTVHPYLGKPGRVPDTRELVMSCFPYVIVYEVESDQSIAILRVLHGHMLWPPKAN